MRRYKRGYASSIVLPLMADSKAFGAINIYSREPGAFSKTEIELLSELANDLSHGIIEITNQEKVIFMDTVGSTDSLTKEKWNRYIFRAGTCNSQEANSLALYAAQDKKLMKFYNIGPDYEYGRTMWEIFKAKMTKENPQAQFLGEQWPKLFEADYTPYIASPPPGLPGCVKAWRG